MNTGPGLRDGFEGGIPQSATDIETAMTKGLLSLDANVLLSFYRYSPAGRGALVEVLRAAGDRVWVSHQAAREFWRNRSTAVDSRNQATEQLREAVRKQQDASEKAIDSWAKQTAVSGDAQKAIRANLADGYANVLEAVDHEIAGAGTVSYDPAKDSVLTILEELLLSRVGSPLPPDEHGLALKEGARRAAERIPPGFRDAEKTEGGGPDGASGDYLVWLQSMKEAERRSVPLVIVTGDEKEDWWWRHRGAFMGPRIELVDEFAQRSANRLFMLRPVQLIDNAQFLDVAVSTEAAGDVARASEDPNPRWSHAAIAELLRRLDIEGREQADVIRFAAMNGGSISRDAIYDIAGYKEDRMLRGFTRPVARITKDLQVEGAIPAGVDAILTPYYGGGVVALSFDLPSEVVEILSPQEGAAPTG